MKRHENITRSKESMKAIIAAGGVVYREKKTQYSLDGEEITKLEFLLLKHRHGRYWDFPKGRQEWNNEGEKESFLETAKREISEETGITNFRIIKRLNNVIKYWVRRGARLIPKEVRLYLVQFPISKIELSHEHTAYRWLSFPDALSCMTFNNSKKVLEEAHRLLSLKMSKK
ncbi:MAG: bis(5'-nucleosyl)-tetraphosphatase [Candidatus Hodarchaeales archaeon]|jgi:8-oxo-dGTP pyrophosphatase MutT (NUDIX family)